MLVAPKTGGVVCPTVFGITCPLTNHMSGTYCTLTPFGYTVISSAGCCPLVSCAVANPWGVTAVEVKGCSVLGIAFFHSRHAGHASSGPIPEPMTDVSTGRNRSPPVPVGSRFVKLMRVGVSFWATISGPRYRGWSTALYCVPLALRIGFPLRYVSG